MRPGSLNRIGLRSYARTGLGLLLPLADLGSGEVDLVPAFAGGDGTPTFTRATTATTINSTGLIVSVASGVPRSWYWPDTLAYGGYLAEGARTNLCLQSEAIGVTTWSAFSNGTTTSNDATAPDGAATADTVTEDSATDARQSSQSGITIVADSTVTMSVFVKRIVGTRNAYLAVSDGTSFFRAVFDLTAGVVGETGTGGTGTFTSSAITEYPSGWWRIAITGKVGAASTSISLFCSQASSTTIASQSYAGDGASKSAWWGAQLEAASFASSYIPTTTASVTRNADVLTYPASGNVGQTATTLYGEAGLVGSVAGAKYLLQVKDGANDSFIDFHCNSGDARVIVADAGVTQASFTGLGTAIANTMFKGAVSAAANSFAAVFDGGTVSTDTSGSVPPSTIIRIGHNHNGNALFGPIKNVAIYKKQRSVQTLRDMTG